MDTRRCRNILDGLIEPTTNEDIAFYASYLAGFNGELLANFIIEHPLESLTPDEQNYLIFGYCWGQKQLHYDKQVFYMEKTNPERVN